MAQSLHSNYLIENEKDGEKEMPSAEFVNKNPYSVLARLEPYYHNKKENFLI